MTMNKEWKFTQQISIGYNNKADCVCWRQNQKYSGRNVTYLDYNIIMLKIHILQMFNHALDL